MTFLKNEASRRALFSQPTCITEWSTPLRSVESPSNVTTGAMKLCSMCSVPFQEPFTFTRSGDPIFGLDPVNGY